MILPKFFVIIGIGIGLNVQIVKVVKIWGIPAQKKQIYHKKILVNVPPTRIGLIENSRPCVLDICYLVILPS